MKSPSKTRRARKESAKLLFADDSTPRSEIDDPLPDIAPLKPTVAYNTYWKFASERQQIFCRRARAEPPPWTDDPILLAHKFTNVYRASDRVSQYLIRNVIYRDDLPDDMANVVFRVLLFKIFNRIETWELLDKNVGPISYDDFSFRAYDEVLSKALDQKKAIYSAAYIMPSGGQLGHSKKHRNHLTLIERFMRDNLPAKLAACGSMQEAFGLIRDYPTIGDFLAYQYVTDINYSTVTNFPENTFVVPGPGAIDGIKKCFSDTAGLSGAEIIRFMAERQDIEFQRLQLPFQRIGNRPLQLIDCQNIFCEVGKYCRARHPDLAGVSDRTRIKQKFRPNPKPIVYFYPPKWGFPVSGAIT